MISGDYFLRLQSNSVAAKLSCDDGMVFIELNTKEVFQCRFEELIISDRIAHISRRITLPNGDVFQTDNNEAIDQIIRLNKRSLASVFKTSIFQLENKTSFAIFSLVMTILLTWSFFNHGIPYISYQIAHQLDEETNLMIGRESFELLDEYILEPSQLNTAKQTEIKKNFETLLKLTQLDVGSTQYKLHFRNFRNDHTVPNALALPTGDIVVTDQLIKLAQHPDELNSVLLHEMGHIVDRHSLQKMISSNLTSIVAAFMFGDESLIGDLSSGLGGWLMSAKYSQKHEIEADNFALRKMLQLGIDPAHSSSILARLQQYGQLSRVCKTEVKISSTGELSCKSRRTNQAETNNNSLKGFLSTHPPTEARVEIAQEYEKCFKQGLSDCHH